ncbi:MAG TPA: CHAP domain-containing protein [Motilibacteraceae bacterium]|nr:CHAP domain-containing protein [Motilibacteraceae bacterium]
MHDVRRGRRPHRRGREPLWVAVLVALLVTALGVGLLTAWLRPEPTVADARGAAMTREGPPPDAYPWSGPVPAGAGDPWGFTQGQCTSFVAWWLNTHGVPFARHTRGATGEATFDDAGGWDTAARQAGFPVSAVPRVGSVAQWHPGEASRPDGAGQLLVAGEHGHVAVVVAVGRHDEVVTIGYDGATHVLERLTTRAPRYLQIGILPPPSRTDLADLSGTGAGGTGGAGGEGSAGSGPRLLSCR